MKEGKERQKDHRERRKESGLVYFREWVKPEHKPILKDAAKALLDGHTIEIKEREK